MTHQGQGSWKLSALAVSLLVLLGLACQPAQQPTAAPQQTTGGSEVPAPAATAEPELIAEKVFVVPEKGQYVEKAGLRLFVPEGYLFGGPVIPPDPRQPRYGGVTNRNLVGDPPSLDPWHTTASQMTSATGGLFDRLVHLPVGAGVDPFESKLIGGLAESWDISDDFLTYTFHLRKGVKFHNLPPVNGRELTSDDVLFTYELFTSEGSVEKGFFNDVERVEAPNRYTFVYHMKKVAPGFLTLLTDPGKGYILPRESKDYNRRIKAIGSGAYMAEGDYEYKVGIKWLRNPDYWDKDPVWGNQLPYIDGINTWVMPDASARLAAFRTGKLDTGAPTTTPQQVRDLLKTNPTTIIQERSNHVSSIGIALRLDQTPWSDVRVRRAMSLAIDYETWTQTVYGAPANPQFNLSGYWYGLRDHRIPTLTKECGCPWFSYDPKRAKELLAEAGYPNGFQASFDLFPYTPQTTETVELFAAYWKTIGVDVKIRTLDYTVFRRNIDLGLWTDMADSFIFPLAGSADAAVKPFVPGHAANPAIGWVNDPEMTRLVGEYEASYRDEAKQKDILRQIFVRFLDQVYGLSWSNGIGYGAHAPRLRNYQGGVHVAIGDGRVFNPSWIDEEWTFDK